MPWILALSYWFHLLATVIWLGGIVLLTLFAWPAWQRGSLAANQWWEIQRKFVPLANASWIALLLTGFYQMTNDANYDGFLTINSPWAAVILLKHIAFIGMVAVTIYMQAVLHPAMKRAAVLAQQKPQKAAQELSSTQKREILLLRINLVCALIVLFFTAVATAL
jgi:uncharacterized membrane protein